MDNLEGWAQLGFSFAVSGFLLIKYQSAMEKHAEKLAEISTTLKLIVERLK